MGQHRMVRSGCVPSVRGDPNGRAAGRGRPVWLSPVPESGTGDNQTADGTENIQINPGGHAMIECQLAEHKRGQMSRWCWVR